ncbi:hypothetical protein N234_37875 [Ralstonia pickettii DTP0602]|nr:hypothetical protein N234_37875 [Ralstonia pickettii DTP0602]
MFSGTNKGICKSADPAATIHMLRFDDTNAGVATATDSRALMIESPTAAKLSGGQYWNKGSNNATAKQWVLIG